MNHPHGSLVQPSLPYGSGPATYDAQRDRIPTHGFAGQHQAVYHPSTVVLPNASPTATFTNAAAFASQNGQSVHFQPPYQPQGPQNSNSYYRRQPVQSVHHMNTGSSSSHQPSQAGPSFVNQSHSPHNNTRQTVKPTYPPPLPEKPLEFVWDKDNSTDVRFLNIPLQELPLLKSKISEFAKNAPLKTRMVVHPEMAVWKDENAVLWLYIRVEGGFWRYRNIYQFFESQIRLAHSRMGQQSSATMEHISYGMGMSSQGIRKTNSVSGVAPVHPTSAAIAVEGPSSSSIAKPPSNHVVTGTSSQQIGLNGSSSTSILHQPTGEVTPVTNAVIKPTGASGGPSIVSLSPQTPAPKVTGSSQGIGTVASAALVATPSKLTSPRPPIDKKNLSKHILFALGKRPRDVLQRSPESGPPAKKPSLGTFAVSQTPESKIVVSAAHIVAASSAESVVANQPPKSSRDATTSPQPTPLPSTSMPTHVGAPPAQSLSMEINITKPQAASGINDMPLIPNPSGTPVPIPSLNPPTQAITTPSLKVTPSAPVPPAPAPSAPPLPASVPSAPVPAVPASHPLSYNANQYQIASQHVLAVVGNAAPLPPIYQPHYVGSFRMNPSDTSSPTAWKASRSAADRQELVQANLTVASKDIQPDSAPTNVNALRQEQHPPRKAPTSSTAPRQNVWQNAQAGPSNVGSSREPLFLPSPSSSLASHPATPHAQSAPVEPIGKGRKKVYVLVPPRPAYLVAHKRRLAEKRAAHLLGEEGAKAAGPSWESEPGDTYDEPLIIGEGVLP